MALLKPRVGIPRLRPLILIPIVFSVVGSALLVRSRAATPSIGIQPEEGQLTSPAVARFDDATASSGYIRFGSGSSDTLPANAKYVSPTGNDAADGSLANPWRTVEKGLLSLNAGDTLAVRGGTYTERIVFPNIKPGTATSPVKVRAYPGETPVIKGLLHLKFADYWTLDGINVTWDPNLTVDQNSHMVKMGDANNWRWTNSEFSYANAYSAVLLSNGAGWRFDHNYVHDTVPVASHSVNQDHLIYISSGMGGGTIERNSFKTSPNGRGIKIGPPDPGTTQIGNVVIRYNTFYDNQGPSNVQVSYGATNNQIYRNIFVKSKSGYSNVTAFSLNGTGNVVRDNIGWDSTSVVQSGIVGLTDGGGNLFVNPGLTDPSNGDFRPTNPATTDYGRYAPE